MSLYVNKYAFIDTKKYICNQILCRKSLCILFVMPNIKYRVKAY